MTAPDLIALVAPVIPGDWREATEQSPYIAKCAAFLKLERVVTITDGVNSICTAHRADGSSYYAVADFGTHTPSGSHLDDVLLRLLRGESRSAT
jgi:hypothetical protein